MSENYDGPALVDLVGRLKYKIEELEKDRDSWKEKAEKSEGRLEAAKVVMMNALDSQKKMELELAHSIAQGLCDKFNFKSQLNSWKSHAESLAEALKDLLEHGSPIPDRITGEPIPHQANPEGAIEVLKAHEKMKGENP